jgi:dihydroflavonol-4-reductase
MVLPTWVARSSVPLVGLAARLAGSPPVFTRESLAIVAEGNRRISHARAQQVLGYTSRPLDQTVSDSICWFEDEGYLNN